MINVKKYIKQLTLALLSAAFILFLTPSSLPTPTFAQEEPDFDRINEIAKKLSCPTCTGINLADCRTLTCEQWRGQINELVNEGYTDQEVLDYFSTRYGDQVLQEPPRRGFSLALWILPVIVLLAGGGWLIYTVHRWHQAQPTPITAAATRSSPREAPEMSNDDRDYLRQVDRDLGIDEA
ncbi:MAG: cytochrome c-type biogenesis protein CcmH [Anaerolineae bacterium]|nr:cytochrome c-type biogenesis protein CcmH [Anaerolineae bacterium]